MAPRRMAARGVPEGSMNVDLRKENDRLKLFNADLHSQLTTMRQSRTISPEEESQIADLRRQFEMLNKDAIALAVWLRNNKAKEINQGKHMGMSLSDVCIMYMAKGLQ
jgi:hypothetical protein